MKIKILLIVVLVHFVATAQRSLSDTIPFKDHLGLIIVPIKFNGVQKNFMFDTGAMQSIGFSWVERELTKTSKKVKITSSSKRKSKLRYFKSDSINLASAKITKHKILATEDSDIFSCYNIDGVLGVDIISQFNWIINYDQKYVIMLGKDQFPDDLNEMYKIDFEYHNKRPYAFLNFGKERVRFLLDTGANYSDINTNNYDRIKAIDHVSNKVYTGFFDFNGVLTKSKSTTMRFSKVTTNDIAIDGVFDLGKKGNKIGNSLWKGSRLFLSLDSKMLYCDQNNIQEYRKSYGCAFVYSNNKMKVIKVIVDSPAWKKGLRQGDDVKMINGKTFEDFCSLQKFQRDTSDNALDLTITLKDDTTIVLKREKTL